MDDSALPPDPFWSDFRERLGQLRALMPILQQRPRSPEQLQALVSAAALDLELIVSLLADARDYVEARPRPIPGGETIRDRKNTRLNSSHVATSYAVFCLKKKKSR